MVARMLYQISWSRRRFLKHSHCFLFDHTNAFSLRPYRGLSSIDIYIQPMQCLESRALAARQLKLQLLFCHSNFLTGVWKSHKRPTGLALPKPSSKSWRRAGFLLLLIEAAISPKFVFLSAPRIKKVVIHCQCNFPCTIRFPTLAKARARTLSLLEISRLSQSSRRVGRVRNR